MNEREKLLQKLSVARFAAWELHIYLDTHPADRQALARFRQYTETADRLTREYEKLYGPLSAADDFGDASWKWVCSPWPWENEEAK